MNFIQLFSVAEELIGIGIAIIDSDSLREKNSVEVIQPKNFNLKQIVSNLSIEKIFLFDSDKSDLCL